MKSKRVCTHSERRLGRRLFSMSGAAGKWTRRGATSLKQKEHVIMKNAMDKTKRYNTPDGNSVILENPSSKEADPTDSGGDHLLLNHQIIGRSSLTPRTPPRIPAELANIDSIQETTKADKGIEHMEILDFQMEQNPLKMNNKVRNTQTAAKSLTPEIKELPKDKNVIKDITPRTQVKKFTVWNEEDRLRDILVVTKTMIRAAAKQKNVSMEIKSGLYTVEDSIEEILQRRTLAKELARNQLEKAGKQTISDSNNTPTRNSTKRGREIQNSPVSQKTPMEKKQKTAELGEGWKIVPSKESKKKEKKEDAITPGKRTVASSQRTRKKPERKPKPKREAVLIKPAEGKTYAEVLGEIRVKIKPEDTNTVIKSIRQTKHGEVLMEIGKGAEDKAEFAKQIQKVLGETANVKNIIPMTTVEIRDLDSLTTAEEVKASLERDIKESIKVRITITKPNSRQQRMAIVEMEEQDASKLLDIARIKIGFVYCRVRKWTVVTRCYRCLGYGHFRRDCKGPDRTKACYKCSQVGHKGNECTKKAYCVICEDLKDAQVQLEHITGTGNCKAFRVALDKEKRHLK